MKPTVTQAKVITVLAGNGGRIERWPGGFWTYAECPISRRVHERGRDYRVPEWFVAWHTIAAMVKRGWMERTGIRANAQLDDYRLTLAAYEIGRTVE